MKSLASNFCYTIQMKLSILQLNINADNYWDSLINFLYKNDFDILQLQEVTGKDTISGNIDSKIDCFNNLSLILKEKYNGELLITQRYSSGPDSYIGNATFYKKEFLLTEKDEITLHRNVLPFASQSSEFDLVGRKALDLKLKVMEKEISFINLHGAWGGTTDEKPFQKKQLEKFIKYLKSLKNPFVFTGDLNIAPDQPSILKISELARNLIAEYQILNTLNPRTHTAKALFPPGAAVDYVFVSGDIKVTDFRVLKNEDISDHLGLTAEIEV